MKYSFMIKFQCHQFPTGTQNSEGPRNCPSANVGFQKTLSQVHVFLITAASFSLCTRSCGLLWSNCFPLQKGLAGKSSPHTLCWSGALNADGKRKIELLLNGTASSVLPRAGHCLTYSPWFCSTLLPTQGDGLIAATLHINVQESRPGEIRLSSASGT